MKSKQLTKLILAAIIFLIFFSCQQEESFEPIETLAIEQATNADGIKIEIQNLAQINSNVRVLEELEKATPYITVTNTEKTTGLNRKIAFGFDQQNYTIVKDNVSYIENGEYHSYTFTLIRNTPSPLLENLLISLNTEGGYDAYVVTYTLTEAQKQELVHSANTLDLTDYTTFTRIENFNVSELLSPTSKEIHQDAIGGYCYVEDEEVSRATGWTIVVRRVVSCGGGGDNGGGNNGSGNPSGGGGPGIGGGDADGGGGGSGSGNGNPNENTDNNNCFNTSSGACIALITMPTGETVTVPLLINTVYYALGLYHDSPQIKWLSDGATLSELVTLYDYVNLKKDIYGNLNSDEKNFVKVAIDTWMGDGEVDFEDKIINQLTGKADCVYQKLKTTNGDLFKKTIGTFIEDPNYNLNLTIGECNNTDVACTDGNEVSTTGEITIIIEDINQPTLELAATILHEGIHAEIFRYVSRYENNLDPNNRARLFQLYQHYKNLTNQKNYTGQPVTDAQHVYMAENYVTPIAKAIRQLDGNRYTLEYYMWYGWEGLEGEDFKHKLTPELRTKYNNYQTTVNANTTLDCN